MSSNDVETKKPDESELVIDQLPIPEDSSEGASKEVASDIILEDETYSLDAPELKFESSENEFWISPEEFYEDCGCGLDNSCLTACSEGFILSSADDELDDNLGFVDDSEEVSENDDDVAASDETDPKYSIPKDVSKVYGSSKVNPSELGEDTEESDEEGEDEIDRTCFIASAAYGDPMHQDVIQLRNFRDEWLAHRSWGRLFIKFYWLIGPSAARHVLPISRTAKLVRFVVRLILFAFKRFR